MVAGIPAITTYSEDILYNTSTAFLEALNEAEVSFIFANLGSDHPALVEALAESAHSGRKVPTLITCPNEMVGLSAAQGFANVSGRAQAVVVHVECGTQSLAGAIHNAAKSRTPVLIFAGASPYTQEGELRGSRNEFIHWIQDVHDQRGIVRGYMRYDNEIRTGRNIKQLVHRALQFAQSDPKGPVYLMGAREVMEEEVTPVQIATEAWQPIAPTALSDEAVETIANAILAAHRPLVVTSYLGRNSVAVEQLIALCDKFAIGVLESAPSHMNFPTSNIMHQGNQWTPACQHPALAEADLVLVLDSDVPWVPTVSRPRDDARIIHIDLDPLKEQMPLWYIGATRVFKADTALALRQINQALDQRAIGNGVAERRAAHARSHQLRQQRRREQEVLKGETITTAMLTACLRERLDESTIVLNEGVTNYQSILDHLELTRPGSMFTAGGGSLGWSGGAAVGAKLAAPDSTVISLTGDGSFMFSVPSSVHWMARRYETPFLQIIYNNGGWKAPKMSTLAVHPQGYASRAKQIGVSFEPQSDYAAIAVAAGGAFGRTVRRPDELEAALDEALDVVRREKRSAVLDVWLPSL
jgi:acetolactate synthase-1/2/3 large subunit